MIGLGLGHSNPLLGITYLEFETVRIDLSAGPDMFTILDTITGLTQLNGGPGNDVIDVRATSGATQVDGGSDTDVINVGSAAGLVATADLADPVTGGHIGVDELNARGYLDVSFRSFGVNSLDQSTVSGNELRLGGAGLGTAMLAAVTPIRLVLLPGGALADPNGLSSTLLALSELSDVFRYRFNGQFQAGGVTVEFLAGTWFDRVGQPNVGGQEAFTVEIPMSQLANPPPGSTLDAILVNDRPTAGHGYVDVTFRPTTGAALGNETFSETFAGTPSPGRITFTPSRTPLGPITATIGTGLSAITQIFQLDDLVNGDVVLDSPVIVPVTLSYSAFSINGNEIQLAGPGVGTAVTLDGTAVQVTGTTYRYGFTGSLVGGTYTVTFVTAGWRDDHGNLAAGGSASFTTQVPTAALAAPLEGQVLDAATLNATHSIDVTYAATSDSTLVGSSITDPAAEFVLSGPGVGAGGVAITGVGQLVSGTTATYRYAFTGSFIPGQYTVQFIAGSFGDSGASLNLAQTQTFRVVTPTSSTVAVALRRRPGRRHDRRDGSDHDRPGVHAVARRRDRRVPSTITATGPSTVTLGQPTWQNGNVYRYTVTGGSFVA